MALQHRRFWFVVAAFMAGILSFAVSAQNAARIDVGANVHVSAERSADAHYETWIGIDPTDNRRLLACSMVSSTRLFRYTTVVYRSDDGGAHWEASLNTDGLGQTGDPVCTFSPDGTAYYVVLSARQGDPRKMLVYRSSDGGATWSTPTQLPFVDRAYLVFDATGGARHGRAYIDGAGVNPSLDSNQTFGTDVSLFRSDDRFTTYDGPAVRIAMGNAHVLGMGNSVVLSDGTVVTLFGELRDRARSDAGWFGVSGSPNAWLKIVRSSDGGESLEPSIIVSDWFMNRQNNGAYIDPRLAVDAGPGVFRDRLYAVWADARTGRIEIRLSHSDDRGATWSHPITVNDDRARQGEGNGPDAMNPTVAVNANGVVAATWADRRDHDDNLGWDTRFSASLDGGDTWLPSVPVSSKPNRFGGNEAWAMYISATGDAFDHGKPDLLNVFARLDTFFFSQGDTAALAADGNGVFHAIWTDNRTGVSQVWTAPVTVRGQVQRHGDPALSDLADVTTRVRLLIDGKSYDRRTNVVTLVVRLQNIGPDVLLPPLNIRTLSTRSDIGIPQAQGADNGIAGPGAVWNIAPQVPGGQLRPGDKTEPRTLAFRLLDVAPLRTSPNRPWPMFLDFDARVLARVGR